MQHYAIERLIGTGGSGRVYRARDQRLGRLVALKLLRRAPGEPSDRYLREAQMQARLEHPAIAQVYETGEFDGRPAIAMQYVEGPTLGQARDRETIDLSVDQLLEIIEAVARGMHTAHQQGLVHRDLKPGNVLLQQGESGWQPVVVDFGLAVESDAPQATATGSVVGTPEYMSPEQLRGERGRSVDIYALGTMLYEFVAGQRPYEADSRMDLVLQVLQRPAPPVRSVAEVDYDLAAVVDRAVAHEVGDRYGSALQLAEDLARYRAGLPVSARPLGRWARGRRWVARHRALSAATAGVAVLLLSLGTGLLLERWRGQRNALAAQQFAQVTRDVEWRLRVAEMSPLHDVSSERQLLRSREAELDEQMQRLGRNSRRAGLVAKGQLHLALGHDELAHEFLQAAVDAGASPPGLWEQLGLALAQRYRRELIAASSIRSEQLREQRLLEIEQAFLSPARDALVRALEEQPTPPESTPDSSADDPGVIADAWRSDYLAATLAFLNGNGQEALAQLDQIVRAVPWFYDAHLLAAEVLLESARSAAPQADAIEVARSDPDGSGNPGDSGKGVLAAESNDRLLRRAQAEVVDALRIASSSLPAHRGHCEMWTAVLDQTLFRTSDRSWSDVVASGQPACDDLTTVGRRDPMAWVARARFLTLAAQALDRAGEAAEARYEEAVGAAERAVELGPELVAARVALGQAQRDFGRWQARNGIDPRPVLRLAVQHAETAAQIEATAARLSSLGLAHSSLARQESFRGGDDLLVSSHFEAAENALRSAVELAPDRPPLHLNLGEALKNWGLFQLDHGEDSIPTLRRSVESITRATELDPEYSYAWWSLGVPYWYLGDAQLQAGLDASDSFDAALAAYARCRELNPDYANAYADAGIVHALYARQRSRDGEDPGPEFESGLELLAQAQEINPRMIFVTSVRAHLLMDWAKQEMARGEDPTRRIAASEAEFRRALVQLGRDSHVRAAYSSLLTLAGDWLERSGDDPLPSWRRALEELDSALEIDGGCASCLLGEAELQQRLARYALARGQGAALAVRRAREAIDKAFEEDPANPAIPVAMATNSVLEAVLDDDARLLATARADLATARQLRPDDPGADFLEVLVDFAASRCFDDRLARSRAETDLEELSEAQQRGFARWREALMRVCSGLE